MPVLTGIEVATELRKWRSSDDNLPMKNVASTMKVALLTGDVISS